MHVDLVGPLRYAYDSDNQNVRTRFALDLLRFGRGSSLAPKLSLRKDLRVVTDDACRLSH